MNENFKIFKKINETMIRDIITVRRKSTGHSSNNISAKASLVLNALLDTVIETGINEVTISTSSLAKLFNSNDTSNVARDMKTYFKGYGLGDFASTRKYKIFKVIEGTTSISTNIKSESTYTFYINKETLSLLKDYNICEDTDFNKLINDIPRSIQVLEQVKNKKSTEVTIRNYIDENYYTDTKIEVEKDLLNKQGTYKKSISTEKNGITLDTTIVKEDEFIPKECKSDSIILASHLYHAKEEVSFLDKLSSRKPLQLSGENQQKLHKNDENLDKNDQKLEKLDQNYTKIDKNKEDHKQYTISEEEKEERKKLLGISNKRRAIPNR